MKSFKKLFNIKNLYIILYVFSIFKHSNFFGKMHWIVLLPLSIISTIFLCLVLIIAAIYYEIVDFVLKLMHGNDYYGIMDGTDLIWVVEEGTSSIIHIIILADAKDGEGCESLFEFLKSSFENICKTHSKMSCVRRYFMGYGYFLKTHININEHVKYLEDYKDVEGLNLLMQKMNNSRLPIENSALWEVHIGRVALKWKKNGGKIQYPVVIKYHHSLGDGISIASLMTTQLFENGINSLKEDCAAYRSILENRVLNKSKSSFLKNLKQMVNKCYITYFGLLEDNDENMLNGKRLSHEKHVCYFLEKETTNYIEKVKSIKNRFKGITFSDVIMSAFSASCAEYYMDHDEVTIIVFGCAYHSLLSNLQDPPEKIRIVCPYYVASVNFNSLVSTGNNGEIIANLKNNFTMGFQNVQIKDRSIVKNMVDRLLRISEDSQNTRDSLDFPSTLWQIKVALSLIPLCLSNYMIKVNRTTAVLTNMPGNKIWTFSSGHRVRDVVILAPNYMKCGITFTVFTYEGLLRFGLLVDKEIIKEESEVQHICDNVIKYIDVLDTSMRANEEI